MTKINDVCVQDVCEAILCCVKERDTCRDLCGDIAKDIDYAILAINNDFGSVELLLEIKAKIEKLLVGDK